MSPLDQKAQYLKQLRQQYDQGTLSKEDLDRLMLEAIEQESMKKEADYAWVDACCQLMQDTEQEDALPEDWPDHRQAIWENIQAAMEQEEVGEKVVSSKPNRWLKALVAAACIAFTIGGITLSISWYEGAQIEDGQTYELRGQTVEVGKGQQATAAGDEELQEVETEDIAEIHSFLGLTVPMPTWIPDGWVAEPYAAYTFAGTWDFTSFYANPDVETLLLYECGYAEDPSMISIGFPQDGEGQTQKLKTGETVYFSTNVGDVLAVWEKGNMYFFIEGPITKDEIIRMIESIQGGDAE